METSLVKTIGQVAAIGGISLGIVLLLFKDAVQQQIIPLFREKEIGTRMLRSLRTGVWTIAVAGVAAWVFSSFGGADAIRVTNNEFSGDMIFVSDASILSQLRTEGSENPDDPEVNKLLKRGAELVRTNNFEEAIPVYKELASKANVSSIFNNLGLLYAMTDDVENARASYAKSVKLDPANQSAQYNFGLLEEKQGNTSAALERFNKAPDISTAEQLARKIRKNVKAGAIENEPNNDKFEANIIPLNKPVAGSISENSDNDIYLFTSPKTYRDWIEVKISPTSTTLRPSLNLYKSNFDRFGGGNAENAQQEFSYQFIASPETEYYAEVRSEYYSGTSGPYQIVITPLHRYDKFEPNDDKQSYKPIPYNKPIKANIMDHGDLDYYEFGTRSEGIYTAELINTAPTLKGHLEAMDENKKRISSINATSEGESFSLDFHGKANVKHYILVSSEYYSGTRGDYELIVRKKPGS